jgi:membrane protein implicated in regulation of membrane protease activity
LIFGIPAWALWATAATALAIGEVFTPGLFFLGPVAVAAFAAALVAVFAGGLGALFAFIAVSVVCIALLRPLARRHIRLPAMSRTGIAALVGTKGLVLQEVDATGGQVKIAGEKWSARPFLEGDAMQVGEQVEVAEIDGATALVLR